MKEIFTTIIDQRLSLSYKKILFAIVDQAQVRFRHSDLFKKMFQMTNQVTKRLVNSSINGDVKYFDNIDLAMNGSYEYDIVIIQSVGNFIKVNSFFRYLDEYIKSNPEFFLIAFTLDWQSEKGHGWIECHHQMMVVNVNSWKKLSCPRFGEWETAEDELPIYTRSNENFHDNYTPFWIKGEPGTIKMVRTGQGWNFLKTALAAGYRIDNFTEEMRNCRLFTYPEHESQTLYDAFIKKDFTLVTNPNQKKWLRQLFYKGSQIWIFNSEFYYFNIDLTKVDLYIGPAAGFKYLDFLKYNLEGKFIIYDFNQQSLNWIEQLKNEWNGEDFYKYLLSQSDELKSQFKFIHGNKFNKESIERNLSILFRDFGGEDKFKDLWNKFRNSEVHFMKINLFNKDDINELFNKIEYRSCFFYYSNIFSNDFSLIDCTIEEVENVFKEIKTRFKETIYKCILHGSDPEGKWETKNNMDIVWDGDCGPNYDYIKETIKYSAMTRNLVDKKLISSLSVLDVGCSREFFPKVRIFEPLLKGIGVDPIITECARLNSIETNDNIKFIPIFIHSAEQESIIDDIKQELSKEKIHRNRHLLKALLKSSNFRKRYGELIPEGDPFQKFSANKFYKIWLKRNRK